LATTTRTRLIVLGGPTGSGKNAAALELARARYCEIINADSRQIYRELKIGTNQPSAKELEVCPHHLFGFLEPQVPFSVADYDMLSAPLPEAIAQRGNIPVAVGGTGFYIRALLKGTWPVPETDPGLRNRLREIGENRGGVHLHAILKRVDPLSAAKIPEADRYRVLRALEIYFQTGKRKSEIQSERPDRFVALKLYLDISPRQLEERIRKRTDSMLSEGWIEEVKSLLQRYPDFETYPAALSLGYGAIMAFLREETTLDDCRESIVRRTLQYAKRQRTWFRNQDGFTTVHSVDELRKKVESVLE
jgi:tRNA dimethylallyltransferase